MSNAAPPPPPTIPKTPEEHHEHLMSLRRQLDEALPVVIYDENEDLSKLPREDLEQQLRLLRHFHNHIVKQHMVNMRLARDFISHTSTGKDVDYLSLNATQEKDSPTLAEIFAKAGSRALGGGLPGAAAMAIQVCSLMWLRTTMNYQYRFGTSTWVALQTLYRQGGIPRFYQGLVPALAQGPLSRFGDTAANSGTLALLESFDSTKNLPAPIKTVFASSAAASWRIVLMPIDTLKTILQVEGAKGLPELRNKIRIGGPRVLYHGALAASGATFAGHYPWFVTYNTLNDNLPVAETLGAKLLRNGFIGFCSSLVSDTVSNSIRVTKVAKQASPEVITYPEAIRQVVAADGVQGLFFRGLGTRLLANGLQGMMFTVLWKGLEEQFRKRRQEDSM